jgi:uncharacterized protein (DUF2062 family)
MIRRFFKRKTHKKIDELIKKYNIPKEYLKANRKSVTRGVLVGLFWGLIPMPMQMAAVVATTPLLRFNVPIAISMVWLSNPITMPFMYYIEYLTGCFLFNIEPISVELTLEWFEDNLDNILLPLYGGTLFYCVTIPIISAYIVNRLWVHSVRKEKKTKKKISHLPHLKHKK